MPIFRSLEAAVQWLKKFTRQSGFISHWRLYRSYFWNLHIPCSSDNQWL